MQKSGIKVAATVPGGIYTDLRNGGVLQQDILYGSNDMNYRWVAHDKWTYETTFQGKNLQMLLNQTSTSL